MSEKKYWSSPLGCHQPPPAATSLLPKPPSLSAGVCRAATTWPCLARFRGSCRDGAACDGVDQAGSGDQASRAGTACAAPDSVPRGIRTLSRPARAAPNDAAAELALSLAVALPDLAPSPVKSRLVRSSCGAAPPSASLASSDGGVTPSMLELGWESLAKPPNQAETCQPDPPLLRLAGGDRSRSN